MTIRKMDKSHTAIEAAGGIIKRGGREGVRLIDQRLKAIKLRNRYLRREETYLRGPHCEKAEKDCPCRVRLHKRMVENARAEFLLADYGSMSDDECRRFFLERMEWLELCAGWDGGGDFVESFTIVPGLPEAAKAIAWGVAAEYGNVKCGIPDISEEYLPREQIELDEKIVVWSWTKTPAETMMHVDLRGGRPSWTLMRRLIFLTRMDIVEAMEARYGSEIFTEELVVKLMASVVKWTMRCHERSELLSFSGLWSVLNHFESRYPGTMCRFYACKNSLYR